MPTKLPKLIGIAGPAYSGKDTIGEYLFCRFLGVTRLSFAGPLKKAAANIWGFSQEQLYGDKKDVIDPAWGITPRHALQQLGTEVARTIHPETWIRAAERMYDAQIDLETCTTCVFTDVRFPNEAAMITRRGGVLWYVERTQRPMVAAHTSELCWKEWVEQGVEFAAAFCNDGTKTELFAKIELAALGGPIDKDRMRA